MFKLCINCKCCEIVCFLGVKIGDMIVVVCGKYGKKLFNFKLVCDFVFSYIDLFGLIVMLFVLFVNVVILLLLVKKLMYKIIGVYDYKILFKYLYGMFCCWFK